MIHLQHWKILLTRIDSARALLLAAESAKWTQYEYREEHEDGNENVHSGFVLIILYKLCLKKTNFGSGYRSFVRLLYLKRFSDVSTCWLQKRRLITSCLVLFLTKFKFMRINAVRKYSAKLRALQKLNRGARSLPNIFQKSRHALTEFMTKFHASYKWARKV